MRSAFACIAVVLVLSGCATRALEQPETLTRNTNVDQRMLTPESADDGAAKVERYELNPTEVFRMPQPRDAGSPQLPVDSPRQTLTPTTVCTRVVIAADGRVQRAELLDDRSECNAGAQPQNHDLAQAALSKVQQWTFVPAAVCHFAADAPPASSDSCAGAQTVEPVPVTLLYAFTFEVEQGRVHVQTGGMGGR